MKAKSILSALLFVMLICLANCQTASKIQDKNTKVQQKPEIIEVKKIWNQAPHNAFTDLAWNKGKFW